MKKMLKRVTTLIIATIICFSVTVDGAFASVISSVSADTKEKIVESLYFVEMNKENYNLEHIKFEELLIGSPVHCYEYTSAGFNDLRIMYPLLCEGALVAFAIPNEEKFQINTYLAELVGAEESTTFAIVYDDNGCYLYTEEEGFTLLVSNSTQIKTRLSIETMTANDYLYARDIAATNILSGAIPIAGARRNVSTRQSDSYVGCNVNYVTQLPYDSICWAATIACIVNYVNGSNLTAVDVAQDYYGSDFNHGLGYSAAVGLLSNYNLLYAALSSIPSDTVIASNLRQGYPLISFFNYTNGSHVVCLYGIDALRGYAYIMDPESGFDSATYTSAGYRYVSAYSGVTLTMARVGVRYAA